MQAVALQPVREGMCVGRLNVPGATKGPQTSVSSYQMAQELFHEAIRWKEEL